MDDSQLLILPHSGPELVAALEGAGCPGLPQLTQGLLGEGGRRREGLVRAVESVLGAAKAREVVQVGVDGWAVRAILFGVETC
jgi:hypothetical protein